jgi:hypothetical protein
MKTKVREAKKPANEIAQNWGDPINFPDAEDALDGTGWEINSADLGRNGQKYQINIFDKVSYEARIYIDPPYYQILPSKGTMYKYGYEGTGMKEFIKDIENLKLVHKRKEELEIFEEKLLAEADMGVSWDTAGQVSFLVDEMNIEVSYLDGEWVYVIHVTSPDREFTFYTDMSSDAVKACTALMDEPDLTIEQLSAIASLRTEF